MRKWGKRLGLAAGAMAVFLGVALAALWGLANTERGRTWIAGQVEAALSGPGATARIEGLAGPLPHKISFDEIELRDKDGLWLAIEDARVEWRPWSLLLGRVDVARLRAEQITVIRPPAEGESDPDEPTDTDVVLPRLPVTLRVREIALDRIVLGPEIAGQPAGFRMTGRLAAPTEGALSTSLTLSRWDEPGGEVRLDAAYKPDGRRLDLALAVRGEAGGVLSGAMGLAPDAKVSADLTGSGPLDDWAGGLTAQLGPDAAADLDLKINDERDFSVAGTVDPGALLDPPVPALLGGPLRLDITAAVHDDWSRLAIPAGRVETPTSDLKLSGGYNLSAGTLDAKAVLSVRDTGPLNVVAQPMRVDGPTVTVTAKGPLTTPRLAFAVGVQRLGLPGGVLEGVDADVAFEPQGELSRGRLTADIRGETLRNPAPQIAAYAGESIAVQSEAMLDLPASRLRRANAEARLGDTVLRLKHAEVGLDGGRIDGAYALEMARLGRLDPILNLGLTGHGKLQGNVSMTPEATDPMLRMSVAGALQDVAWGENAALNALAGDVLQLDTDLRMARDGALALGNILLDSGAARITGDIRFPADFSRLDGRFDGRLRDLASLGNALNLPMAGSGRLSARLDGPTGDPGLRTTLSVADARLAGTDFDEINVEADLTNLASGLNGSLRASATGGPTGSVEARTKLALDRDALRLDRGRVHVPGLTAQSIRLDVPLAGGTMTGGAEIRSDDLGRLSLLEAQRLGGRARGRLTLSRGDNGQRVTASLNVRDFVAGDGAAIARADLEADIDEALAAPRGTLEATIEGARAGSLVLQSARLTIDGSERRADASVSAEGELFGPMSLTADAEIRRRNGRTEATLRRLDTRIQSRRIALERPASLEYGPDGAAVRDLVIKAGDGTLSFTGRQGNETVEARLGLDALPLALANLFVAEPTLSGVVNGEVTVTGPITAPRANWNMTGREIRTKGTDLPPLALSLEGGLADGRLTTEGRLDGLSGTPVKLNADVPVTASVVPASVELPPDGKLNASLDWSGEVAPLMPFVPISGHRLIGRGEVALSVGGTWSEPVPEGRITLSDATYENFAVGTLLTDIEARIDASPDALRLASFTASDGDGGEVTGNGVIRTGANAPRLDLRIQSDGAVLVRRDELEAAADSTIDITGPLTDLRVAGTITVVRAEARVPDTLPPEVASLEITEVGGDEAERDGRNASAGPERARENGEKDEEASQVKLDIRVKIPNRLFLRGRGLDTEWSGKLRVTGTAATPRVNGSLRAVRGRISALGKTFDLASGVVTFDGGEQIDPRIDTEAVYEDPDIVVTVNVRGPAGQPAIELSSQPDLPQDEILSRLLFGKEVTDLTAAQAAQLATAVAELTGATGSGPGILERLRRGLGVDVLQFGGSGGAGTSVRAGQYLSEDIFVGVEQGLGPESSRVTVEVDITDNIAVESNVGATGNSNVGLQFKWDY